MYLRKRSIIQLSYILILLFLLLFMVQTTSSFAETLITGQVLDEQGDPIENIKIQAFDTNYGMGPFDNSNANGFYQLNVTWSDPVSEKEFYVCARDPNFVYITECYNGSYEFEGALEPILINSGQTKYIDFNLCASGDISITMDVPYDRGYKISLEGTINFKNTQNIPYNPSMPPVAIFPDETSLPSNKIINLVSHLGTLPDGDYFVRIDDINLSKYFGEQGEISSSTSYWYQIDNFNYFSSQFYDNQYLEENADIINVSSGQTEEITFSSMSETGMIYGIITDPNMNEKTSKFFPTPTTDSSLDKTVVSYSAAEDPNTHKWYDKITLVLNPEKIAIENIYLKIIPTSGQQVIAPTIPSKVLKDPNSIFHIGAGGEFGYGGYAFKFLEPSGTYKIQLYRRIGNTDIFNVYYKDATSVVYSEDAASEISLTSGEKIKKVDIELPSKVTIYGYVAFEGDPITANVSLLTTPSGERQETHKIRDYLADANCDNSYFEFKELIHGEFVVRVECDGYNIERIPINLQLGQNKNLETIQLVSYNACAGNKTIQGRIFSEDNQNIGIENMHVRLINIEDLDHPYEDCLEDITDPNGRYSIPDLPDSLFFIYTVHDPNIVTDAYFNEIYKNVILFPDETIFEPEVDEISSMKANINPVDIDPNIKAELIYFDAGQDVRIINIGLSSHMYKFSKGFNLFAYPGTPPVNYAGTGKKLIDAFSYLLKPHIMSYVTNENKWKSAFKDPNSDNYDEPIGDNFSIKAGQGYVLYLKEDIYAPLPPYTIVAPTFDMIQGLNFISLPDSFEKEYYSQNVLSNLGDEEAKACSINNYNCQTGKWKSTTCLWGLPAGDNFKFERHQGYSVYIKSSNQ